MQLRHLPGLRPDVSSDDSLGAACLISVMQEVRMLEDLLAWAEDRLADGETRWGSPWPTRRILEATVRATCDRLVELREGFE